jgi:hypothetical protein
MLVAKPLFYQKTLCHFCQGFYDKNPFDFNGLLDFSACRRGWYRHMPSRAHSGHNNREGNYMLSISTVHNEIVFVSGPQSLVDMLDLITPREAERSYGVSRAYLAKARKAGAFPPAFDINGCAMHRRADIAQMFCQTLH